MKYHKINGPYKRDMSVKPSPLIIDDWALKEFELLQNVQWYGYEKIDGTNIRIYYDGLDVWFKGREENSDIPKHLIKFLTNKYTVELMKKAFPDLDENTTVTLYGEGYGHKIQKGKRYLPINEVSLILFDITIGKWTLTKEAVADIAKLIDTPTVKLIMTGTLNEIIESVTKGLRCSFDESRFAEGLVCTPVLELFDRAGNRIITKIKHKDFYNTDNYIENCTNCTHAVPVKCQTGIIHVCTFFSETYKEPETACIGWSDKED